MQRSVIRIAGNAQQHTHNIVIIREASAQYPGPEMVQCLHGSGQYLQKTSSQCKHQLYGLGQDRPSLGPAPFFNIGRRYFGMYFCDVELSGRQTFDVLLLLPLLELHPSCKLATCAW